MERKRLRQAAKCPVEIFAKMDEVLQEDCRKRRKLNDEYQKAMSSAKEKYALEKRVADGKENIGKLSAEIKRIEAVVAAMSSEKVYSPEMLGQGKRKGGRKEHKDNRYDTLERVRRIGKLNADQCGQWDFFKTHWDRAQANVHGENWGKVFAEMIQGVLQRLLEGESDAFALFVKNETDRVLGDRGALVVPGIGGYIGQGSCY